MISKLSSIYDSLPAKDRLIADFLRKYTEEFLTMNISEVSQRLGVSSATVSRFIKRVFGMTFPEAKVAFAKSLSAGSAGVDKLGFSFRDSMFQIEMSLAGNIRKLYDDIIQINPIRRLTEIASMIASSETIYLFGIGASALAVQDFAQKLVKLGKRAVFNMDSNLAILNSSLCTCNDLVIAISYSGLTKEVLIPARKAASRGCRVVAMTASPSSPLAQISDYVLQTPQTDSMIVRMTAIYSRYGQFFLVDLLYIAAMKAMTDDPDKIMASYSDLLLELK